MRAYLEMTMVGGSGQKSYLQIFEGQSSGGGSELARMDEK